jgi:hypothetical protein
MSLCRGCHRPLPTPRFEKRQSKAISTCREKRHINEELTYRARPNAIHAVGVVLKVAVLAGSHPAKDEVERMGMCMRGYEMITGRMTDEVMDCGRRASRDWRKEEESASECEGKRGKRAPREEPYMLI